MKSPWKVFGKILIVASVVNLVGSCSTNEKNLEAELYQEALLKQIKNRGAGVEGQDYILRDSSLIDRPEWINEVKSWAESNEANAEYYKYFSNQSGPKIQRALACDISKTNIRAEVSVQIARGLVSNLIGYIETNVPNLTDREKLNNYLENQYADKVQSFVKGAQALKTYWEYREYRVDKGAKENFKAYVCASLIRIHKSSILKAMEQARELLLNNKMLAVKPEPLRRLLDTNFQILIKEMDLEIQQKTPESGNVEETQTLRS